MVRKEQDTDNHSHRTVEGYRFAEKCLFVDDQVATGRTWTRVKDQLLNFAPEARIVATYEYAYDRLQFDHKSEAEPPMTSPIEEPVLESSAGVSISVPPFGRVTFSSEDIDNLKEAFANRGVVS